MLSRREFLAVAGATAALLGSPEGVRRAAAAAPLTQDDLLKFNTTGQVTLLHLTDCHAHMMPLFYREPDTNIGVGAVKGKPPHLVGQDFLTHYDLKPETLDAYMLTYLDFAGLAERYGRIGGLDRMATLVKAIRADRPDNTLFLDGGDTWQGDYTSLQTQGSSMVDVMNAMGLDVMTAHWEFTYGADRVQELIEKLQFPFLCSNVKDTTWEEPVFEGWKMFERGGVQIGVIGQAFPYTPIANPRWMIPDWSFGIDVDAMRRNVKAVKDAGADLVVVLSHNGFDVDRKMASDVEGIDVILTGHTHDALPRVVEVGKTLLVASGSHGKFLSRLDLDVQNKEIKSYEYKLIPILTDVITPDAEVKAVIEKVRGPHAQEADRVLGHTDSLLYRRGNFNGTFDDLICQALLEERDAQIALSPGFRWGGSLLPGQPITVEDVYGQTSITYPQAYRSNMTGGMLKDILEDVADNLFNPDPYYQQGGDMVRVGGMAYRINPWAKMGERISDLTLLETGETLDPGKEYVVTGWASVNEGTEGPPIYDVVSSYIEKHKTVSVPPAENVEVVGGGQ